MEIRFGDFLRLLKRTADENKLGFTYAVNYMEGNLCLSFRDLSTDFVVQKTVTFNHIECAKSMVKLAEYIVGEAIRDIRNHKNAAPLFKNSEVFEYLKKDFENKMKVIKNMINLVYGISKTSIKNVIFNPPATIVFWNDGTKTVVKAQNDETFDPEKGLAMAITKKALGNQGNYFDTIKKYIEAYKTPVKPETKERYRVYVPTIGWIKDRKYEYTDGRKVFTGEYVYTNEAEEAMIWKTKVYAAKNAQIASPLAEVIKF